MVNHHRIVQLVPADSGTLAAYVDEKEGFYTLPVVAWALCEWIKEWDPEGDVSEEEPPGDYRSRELSAVVVRYDGLELVEESSTFWHFVTPNGELPSADEGRKLWSDRKTSDRSGRM